jgi:hypothetical protein
MLRTYGQNGDEPLELAHKPLNELLSLMPGFERHAPSLGYLELPGVERHTHDAIVRMPSPLWEQCAVVANVTERYQLVQHHEVIEQVVEQFALAGYPVADDGFVVRFSPDGAQMEFSLTLPDVPVFDPGDGHAVGLYLKGINSVDGSTALRIFFGWLRLVCSNGMVAGHIDAEYRARHTGSFDFQSIHGTLRQRLSVVESEKKRLLTWYRTPVSKSAVTRWIDTNLAEAWGIIAAARAYHIVSSGHDAVVRQFSPKAKPSEKPIRRTTTVPGSEQPAGNLYAVSQALSWIATQQTEPAARLEWQRDIPGLIEQLGQAA